MMKSCTELTIYKVSTANIARVVELSHLIIEEINEIKASISSYEILQKTDNQEELCWRITWVNEDAVKFISSQWKDLPSTNELMSLVEQKIYYGHFLNKE